MKVREVCMLFDVGLLLLRTTSKNNAERKASLRGLYARILTKHFKSNSPTSGKLC